MTHSRGPGTPILGSRDPEPLKNRDFSTFQNRQKPPKPEKPEKVIFFPYEYQAKSKIFTFFQKNEKNLKNEKSP